MALATGTIPAKGGVASMPLLGNRLAVVGSSTFGYGKTLTGVGINETGNGPLTWAQQLMGSPWDIRQDLSTAGYTSDQILTSMDSLTASAHDGIVIQLGGNDLVEGALTGAQTLVKLDSALTKAWALGASYVAVVIPHNDSVADGGTAGIAAEIEAYRTGAQVRSLADSRIYVIDHYSAVADWSTASRSPMPGSIGTSSHLNNIGARQVAQKAWVPVFDGKITPRSVGSAVTVDPEFDTPTSWTVVGTGTVSARSEGMGGQARAGAVDLFVTQSLAKTAVDASKYYVLALDAYVDSSSNLLGIYFRNTGASWQTSVDRINGGSITTSTGNIGGTQKRIISRRFQIPT
jgi:hypothetical protein